MMKYVVLLLAFSSVVHSDCNILALSGGGSYGAFEVGVTKHLYDTGKRWNVFTGVSAGSLNAGIFSRYNKVEEGISQLENIYSSITSHDIYTINFPFTKSIYSTEPLLHLIHEQLKKTEQNKSIYPTFIGMTNFTDGHLSVVNVKGMRDVDLVYLASSSIPVLFPSTLYKKQYYVDGGLSSDSLISPAVKYCIRNKMYPITIDHVSTYDPNASFGSDHIGIIDSAIRTFRIISKNFDNIISKMRLCNVNENAIAKINLYYPSQKFPFSILDFDHGNELIKAGYSKHKVISKELC